MVIDRYSKLVLTVIACSLSVIAFRGLGPNDAKADSQVHVVVDSVNGFAFQFVQPIAVHNQ